jgi:hypothetical protein
MSLERGDRRIVATFDLREARCRLPGVKAAVDGQGRTCRKIQFDQPEKKRSQSTISVAAAVIIDIACVATISTDAFSHRRGVGVGRAGEYHGRLYRAPVRRGVAAGVAIGARRRCCRNLLRTTLRVLSLPAMLLASICWLALKRAASKAARLSRIHF